MYQYKYYIPRFYSSVGESRKKEYYTLGCLLYFLKNEQMDHPQYVKHAGGEGLPVVSRPDRKVLLSYLKEKEFFNRKDVFKHIDKSVSFLLYRLLCLFY